MNTQKFAAELSESREMREAAFELIRLWRQGWDIPGSSGYQSFIMAYRRFSDLMLSFPEYRGSFTDLAQKILKNGRN